VELPVLSMSRVSISSGAMGATDDLMISVSTTLTSSVGGRLQLRVRRLLGEKTMAQSSTKTPCISLEGTVGSTG
jgi:hypothetical protein